MAHVHQFQPIPKAMLIASAVLVTAAMAFAGVARLTDVGATRFTVENRLESVMLRFADLPDGGIAVTSEAGAAVQSFSVGQGGFVRVVLRTLAQKRSAVNIGADAPFRLSKLDNDLLVLEDPATGGNVLLKAFGPGNAKLFEDLLVKGRQAQ